MPRSPRYPDLPSVTEVLKAMGLVRDYPENGYVTRARQRGQALHKAIELHHKGTLHRASLHPEIAAPFATYLRFLDECQFEVGDSELEVVHADLGFVGHIDQVTTVHALIDFKLSDHVDLKAARLQLAGYRLGYEHQVGAAVPSCLVLQFKKDGTYRLVDVMDDYACQLFQAALMVWRAREGT